MLGAKVVICKPADPEAKGRVQRFQDHLERSFLPWRSFTGPDDFNAQFASWVAVTNGRHMRTFGCRPVDRVEVDRAAMMPPPPVAPVVGWHVTQRLPRDHYVRLDGNDYSVHPSVIGRRVSVTADLSRVVGVSPVLGSLIAGFWCADARRSAWADGVIRPSSAARFWILSSLVAASRTWRVIWRSSSR